MAHAKAGYVDGYVLPVPKKNRDAYKKMAKLAAKVWIEHGALQYLEAEGEDMKKQPFCMNFKQIVEPKRNESIIFAFVLFKSRAHRDKVNKKVMEDPRMNPENAEKDMPFDCKRMIYNGFKTLVNMSS